MNEGDPQNNETRISEPIVSKLNDVVSALNADNQAQEKDRQAQRKTQSSIQRSQWFIFLAGLLSVAVASIYAAFAYHQWQEMKISNQNTSIAMTDARVARLNQDLDTSRSIAAAEKVAVAAEGSRIAAEKAAGASRDSVKEVKRQADISEKALIDVRETERARLTIAQWSGDPVVTKDKDMTAAFVLKNIGHGAASGIDMRGRVGTGEIPCEALRGLVEGSEHLSLQHPLLEPNDQTEVTVYGKDIRGEGYVLAFVTGTLPVVAYGVISWTDQFGDRWEHGFCQSFDTRKESRYSRKWAPCTCPKAEYDKKTQK